MLSAWFVAAYATKLLQQKAGTLDGLQTAGINQMRGPAMAKPKARPGPEADCEAFLERLGAEKLQAQERRGALVRQKIGWITALFAVSLIGQDSVPQLWSLLYLLPFIALIFDLYIVGEDYGIKRMGVFIREAFPLTPEGRWEFSLRRRRDPFSRLALPWATLVVVGGAATLLVVLGRWAGVIPWIWLSASVLAIGALRRDSRRRLIRLEIEAALQHLPTASDSEDARLELLQLLRDYGRAGQDDVVARAGSLLKQVTSAESKESI